MLGEITQNYGRNNPDYLNMNNTSNAGRPMKGFNQEICIHRGVVSCQMYKSRETFRLMHFVNMSFSKKRSIQVLKYLSGLV